MSATTAAWLALFAPLAGAILNGLLFRVTAGKVVAGVIGTAALAVSFVMAVVAFFQLQARGEEDRQLVSSLYDYAVTGSVDVKLSILVDPLSVLMLLVVTGVSMLIHLYSIAYMEGDRGYSRFFAYLNFFVFSMVLLVLAGNFVLLTVGWAFVGAASYLLISFWYRRTTATKAGIKAFVINVVGDVGLVLGTFFIIKHTSTVDFLGTFAKAEELGASAHGDLTAGLILLLVGAFAKSAQVPLHTWLPDAMEGPTPVSALIHAATMVTAGVYLIARMHPLFEQSAAAANTGAIVGCLTLLIAATIGMVVTDLKRVIAYSTMSQIGYMVMAVSAGVYVAGLFHLMTHAFFKALLFMAAGSVISAMGGEQNLDRMRGFRKAMPFTYGAFVIGGLALAGIPPFSGFFSKDEILLGIGAQGGWHWALYVAGYVAALMTAFYTWRMIFRAFHGEPCEQARELEQGHLWHAPQPVNPATGEVEDTDVGFPGPEHHIAEQALPMRVAMGVLAFLAIVGGVVGIPKVTHWLEEFLHPTFHDSAVQIEPSDGLLWFGLVLGAAVGLLGIWIAYRIYVVGEGAPARRLEARFSGLHRLFVSKWWFDELIDALIVRPASWIGRFARDTFERLIVQGALIGGTTGVVRAGSAAARALQTGFLRAYAGLVVLGVAALLLFVLVAG
ncbi:MAG: NADH-quinone oxidoreductase subunit L [Baekduia sp.]